MAGLMAFQGSLLISIEVQITGQILSSLYFKKPLPNMEFHHGFALTVEEKTLMWPNS